MQQGLSSLPSPTSLVSQSTATRIAILDALFEPCEALHTLGLPITLKQPQYSSYDALIDRIQMGLTELHESTIASDDDWLVKILGAHPRLGPKKHDVELSEASKKEQEAMGAEFEGEGEKLEELNAEYEKTFPGLIYVTFVAGRPRSVLMEDMKGRIARGDLNQEKQDAIKAMCDIAKDRASKMAVDQ